MNNNVISGTHGYYIHTRKLYIIEFHNHFIYYTSLTQSRTIRLVIYATIQIRLTEITLLITNLSLRERDKDKDATSSHYQRMSIQNIFKIVCHQIKNS